MTVKATLAYGKSFHFYHEALDNNHVYLELEDVPYEVGYRRLLIAIPIDVWEVIRGLGAANLDLVNTSDEDIAGMVAGAVGERVAAYERALASDRKEAERLRFDDSLVFGAADSPRERQVMRGVEYYKTERERQREVAARMAQHKILDIDNETSA